jgi:hypothetical protein
MSIHCARDYLTLSFLVPLQAGRPQLIKSHQTGTRVSILFLVLAICNPFACRIGSGPPIVSKKLPLLL